MGWQWYQLDHMQVVFTLLQTDNRASTSSGRMLFLPPNQQYQSTKGTAVLRLCNSIWSSPLPCCCTVNFDMFFRSLELHHQVGLVFFDLQWFCAKFWLYWTSCLFSLKQTTSLYTWLSLTADTFWAPSENLPFLIVHLLPGSLPVGAFDSVVTIHLHTL